MDFVLTYITIVEGSHNTIILYLTDTLVLKKGLSNTLEGVLSLMSMIRKNIKGLGFHGLTRVHHSTGQFGKIEEDKLL